MEFRLGGEVFSPFPWMIDSLLKLFLPNFFEDEVFCQLPPIWRQLACPSNAMSLIDNVLFCSINLFTKDISLTLLHKVRMSENFILEPVVFDLARGDLVTAVK